MKRIWRNLKSETAFWFCLVISVVLLIASFILPPTGEINSSVIASVGELFAFATLATVIDAIKKGSDISLKRGEFEVNIDNPDAPEPKID